MAEPTAPGQGCPRCGGPLVDGRVGLAVLATLRFVVRIGTTEIGTDVRARMCEDCGHLELVAKDPQAIARAGRARLMGRTSAPASGLFRGRRPPDRQAPP